MPVNKCPKCNVPLKKFRFIGLEGEKGGWFVRYLCPKCGRYWTSDMIPMGYIKEVK